MISTLPLQSPYATAMLHWPLHLQTAIASVGYRTASVGVPLQFDSLLFSPSSLQQQSL